MKDLFQGPKRQVIFSVIVVLSLVLSPIYIARTSDIHFSEEETSGLFDIDENSLSRSNELCQFSSFTKLTEYIEYNRNLSYHQSGYGDVINMEYSMASQGLNGLSSGGAAMMMSGAGSSGDSIVSGTFSSTNIQVQGVDEGDIVKNDNQYAYVLSSGDVTIIDVFPPEQMKVVKVLNYSGNIKEIYVNHGMLVIVGWDTIGARDTFVHIYDLENITEPELVRNESLKGTLVSSRIVNSHLYLITNSYASDLKNESQLPAPIDEIYYVNEYDYSYHFTIVHSINFLNATEPVNRKVIMSGGSRNIYASTNNIYVTCQRRLSRVAQDEIKIKLIHSRLLPEKYQAQIDNILSSNGTRWEQMSRANRVVVSYLANCSYMERKLYYQSFADVEMDVLNSMRLYYEKTIIHRIMLNNGNIEVMSSGQVDGSLLNRFSMDEYDGYFRIATTTGQVSRSGDSTAINHLYVLNMDLNITGSIDDIAPGERIYSARFMGERGYIVTFKKIDPFFIIDLSNPNQPAVAGELKIPGYSDYLHPIDENHVLGIGKDTIDMGDFAWYQGVKISLFDVTDMNNPKETDNYIIGDRGTESAVLRDPHALLFSQENELFVLPIALAELNYSMYSTPPPPSTYGSTVWVGAYVFNYDVEDGFVLKGTIEHDQMSSAYPYYYYYGSNGIHRTFYMDNYLFSVSNTKVMVHNLDTLDFINEVDI